MHLAASIGLVGHAALLLLAGRSDRPTALAWQARIVGWSSALVVVAVGAGLVALGHQTAVVSGRPAAALEPAALAAVLTETHAGRIWLTRLGLLVLVAAFVGLMPRLPCRGDWLAVRGEAALLGALALGLAAAAGHAAAVAPDATLSIAFDALHLLATGIWIGGLPALAALLVVASSGSGADARPYAVLAAHRFSRVALGCLGVLVVSGVANAIAHVGGVVALLGTAHGRWLVLKLGLLVPIVLLGWVNRHRLLPKLSGEAERVGRPAMRVLGRFVAVEAALALGVIAIVALMSLTPPARHVEPTWPLGFRFTLATVEDAAGLRARVLIGGQVVVLSLVAVLCAGLARRRRVALAGGGVVLLALGVALALPPIAVDAYPTTYRRPGVTYHAASIVEGAALYRTHCASCHGPAGAGDGPARPAPWRSPGDLRGPRVARHTAGDLYWWITSGIPAARMPAFGAALDEAQRWHVINFVRALGGAQTIRQAPVGLARPEVVAPDFAFAVGPTPARVLKDYRGRRIVLVVLYTLPGSGPRLRELALTYDAFARRGVEVVAVPRDAAPDAIRRLGGDPPILFPVVTEGALEITAAYELFAPGEHAEVLIDRQGYLRARWTTPPPLAEVAGAVDRLNAEPAVAPPAAEHVH